MTLGQKLKKLRTEKGITQKELADQLHVTFQTISKWESDTNEPDISTLKELAKFYDCSVDYLINENEEDQKEQEIEEEPNKDEPVTQTVVIHQRELHVCERCKKDIPDGDLVMEDICVRHYGRGHAAEYRKAYYHRHCLDELKKQRAEQARQAKLYKSNKSAKLSFGWGIAGGVVALVVSLLVLLLTPSIKEVLHPASSIGISIGASYAIFAMLYCIISGSYIGEVFLWCSSLSIKFPGLIFSWSIEGFAWLIVMKVLFAIIGFLVGVFALFFAIVFSAALGSVSFPFVLIHNIRTDYEDAL